MGSSQRLLKKGQLSVLPKDSNGAERRGGSYFTFKYLRASLVYLVQNHKGKGSCSFLAKFQTQYNIPHLLVPHTFGRHTKYIGPLRFWRWNLSMSYVIKITEAGTSAIHIYSWIVLEYPGLIIKIFFYGFSMYSFVDFHSINARSE